MTKAKFDFFLLLLTRLCVKVNSALQISHMGLCKGRERVDAH